MINTSEISSAIDGFSAADLKQYLESSESDEDDINPATLFFPDATIKDKKMVTFGSWLEAQPKDNGTMTPKLPTFLSSIFNWADTKGDAVASNLATVSEASITSAGSLLSSLGSLLASCGPFCAHALGGLVSGSSSGIGGLGGLSAGGDLGFDKGTSGSLFGSFDSGKIMGKNGEIFNAAQLDFETLQWLIRGLGNGLHSVCFGLIDCLLFDWWLPHSSQSTTQPA